MSGRDTTRERVRALLAQNVKICELVPRLCEEGHDLQKVAEALAAEGQNLCVADLMGETHPPVRRDSIYPYGIGDPDN